MSGTSINPKRQMIPSTDASGSVRLAASSTANSMPSSPSVGGTAARDLDHLRRRVRREQLSARLDQRQHLEPGLAGPGCEVEDPLPGCGIEQLDHPRREHRRRTREQLPLALPARSDAAPALDLLRREVAYAATPLKAGMMCSP